MKLCEQLKDYADIYIVSDEAFTLLLLENQYDKWLDIYIARKNGPQDLPSINEKRKRKWESDVSPRYTNGGILYKDNCKMASRGWTETGIQHFNDLCHMVSADRQGNQAMVQRLKVWWSETHGLPKQKINKEEDWDNGPTPFHHLWDDDDDTDPREEMNRQTGGEDGEAGVDKSKSSSTPVATEI
jgi:hypothetical protein